MHTATKEMLVDVKSRIQGYVAVPQSSAELVLMQDEGERCVTPEKHVCILFIATGVRGRQA